MSRMIAQITRPWVIRACAAAVLLVGMSTAMFANAQSRTVGPGPDCHFSDLQTAIDAVEGIHFSVQLRLSGDAAFYHGGTYEIDMTDWDITQGLTIRGGYESCDDESATGQTTLDADGNGRIFNILYDVDDSAAARRVTLENLIVTGGSVNGAGGGIRIAGHSGRQRVRIRNSLIAGNEAVGAGNHGGGIELFDTAGPLSDTDNTWVATENGVAIFNNVATGGFGGGIHCLNPAGGETGRIAIGGPVALNEASGGGGIAAGACTIQAFATINANRATGTSSDPFDLPGNGGGIFLIGGATMTLTGASETIEGIQLGHPANSQVRLVVNQAESQGGGAYTRDEGTKLELVDIEVTENHADFAGGGLYIDVGSELHMHRASETTCMGNRCSRLSGNTALGDGGGALGLRNAIAFIDNTFIQDNVGTNLASAVLAGGGLDDGRRALLVMGNVLISGNHGADNLFWGFRDVHFAILLSTIAGNQQPETDLTLFEMIDPDGQADVRVDYSILWEPESGFIVGSSGKTDARAVCVIGHAPADQSGFETLEFYSHIDPAFENPGSGKFRLSADSPAIDYCDGSHFKGAPEIDLLNRPRGVPYDLPTIEPPNALGGNFDLGAFERQPDALFEDRFDNSSP